MVYGFCWAEGKEEFHLKALVLFSLKGDLQIDLRMKISQNWLEENSTDSL